LRDYEIIICGSTLVKPDMNHMETWPELFKPDETFVAHKWDLSDFEEVISKVLNHDDWRQEIALRAQNAYRGAVSEKGMDHFAERLIARIKD
jgi:spore maturation protein CgeB